MTDLLLKLLGVRMNEAVHIAKASLSFGGGVGRGWLLLVFIVAAALTWWFYRLSPVHISRGRKLVLAGLRVLFLSLILLLLLRPILSFTVEGSVRRLLVMLIDTSSSMQIKDPRIDQADQRRVAIVKGMIDPAKGLNQTVSAGNRSELDQVPRVDVVRAALKNQRLNLLPHLDREFDLEAFAFAQGVAGLSADKAATNNTPDASKVPHFSWVDRLGATNPATAIGDALREVINRKRGQPLAGILMITDGANNSGSQPREAATLLRQM